jgi:MFS family permease
VKPREAGAAAARLRPLAGVLAAMAVSLTGTRVSAVALPWFVLVTTGSATRTGLVALCEMAPYVLVKAFSGPLVDRVGPRLVSWTTDVVSAGAVLTVPLLHGAGTLRLWVLLALVAVIGASRGPGDLAKEVMVPEAADRARVPLERATGASGVTERCAATAGPAVGGAMIALLGPLAGLVVNGVCFALGSVIVALFLPRGMGGPPPAQGAPPDAGGARRTAAPGYWRRFGEGFAFLRGEPLLLTVIVMVSVTNFLDAAFTMLLVPVWARESGHGPAGIGLTLSTMGATAVLGSLVAAAVAHRMRRRPVFFAGFLLAGAPRFLVLAWEGAPLGAVLAVFAVAGFGAGFLNPIIAAVAYERIPRHLLGRVNALGDSLAWAGIPLGGVAAGASVGAWGLAPTLLVCGGAYLLTTTLAGLRREWREMDATRGAPATEGGNRAPTTAGR